MRTAVVIPVFNERQSLPLVVADIPATLVSQIVVVDNGSSDDTERLMAWYDERRAAKRAAFAAQGLKLDEAVDVEDDIIAKVREYEAAEANQGEGDSQEPGDRDKLFRPAKLRESTGQDSIPQIALVCG